MVFTTVAYTESQDSAVLIEIAACADQHVTVQGDNIRVPLLDQLAGYHFMGANFTQGQIDTPTVRATVLIDVEPADLADEPASPAAFHDRFPAPVPLKAGESMRALMAEDFAGASRVTAVIWLSDGPIDPVGGDIYTVRATSATTLTADAWTNCALTFSQTLPVGGYELVGARGQSAGLRAFRAVFPGGTWRPGAVGFDADGDVDVPRFRYGMAGVWGVFENEAPPTIDCLSASADTAEVFHLDVRKVA